MLQLGSLCANNETKHINLSLVDLRIYSLTVHKISMCVCVRVCSTMKIDESRLYDIQKIRQFSIIFRICEYR